MSQGQIKRKDEKDGAVKDLILKAFNIKTGRRGTSNQNDIDGLMLSTVEPYKTKLEETHHYIPDQEGKSLQTPDEAIQQYRVGPNLQNRQLKQ